MSKHYTLKKVNELAGGDVGFVKVLVQTFLEEIPLDMNSMEFSVNAGDAAMAYQYAHKMKPSFQLFEIEVLNYIKIIESWSAEEIGQKEAEFALKNILEKSNAAIVEMKNDFKFMLAEIITIGDEILIGQIVDTNSAFISTELNKIGIDVYQISSVSFSRCSISSRFSNYYRRFRSY